MQRKTICITGGEGFIGRNLKKQLEENHKVFTIDIQGSPDLKEDLSRDELSTESMHLLSHCDVLYHLASGIGVEYIEKDKESFLKSNKINENILKYINPKAKIIFASTSEVYGSGNGGFFAESDNLQVLSPAKGIRGSYAAQKILGEFMFMNSSNPYTIVRFFNVIGKEQNPEIGMVYPRFLQAAKNNEDLVIFGDGTDMRTYCSIKDAANVLELLIDKMDNEILNIGAWNPLLTESLARIIIDVTKSKSKIVHKDARKTEISIRRPDLNKMYSIYKPKYTVEDIIKEDH